MKFMPQLKCAYTAQKTKPQQEGKKCSSFFSGKQKHIKDTFGARLSTLMISANKGKDKKLYDENIQNDLFITLYKGMIQKTCRLYHLDLIAKN